MRLRPLALSLVLGLTVVSIAVTPRTARAVDPHHSWSVLPTGNGYGFATYDGEQHRVTFFSDHPYVQGTPTTSTHLLAYDAYFGVRAQGGSAWLGELPVDALEYRDQSHVVHATQSSGSLRAETYVYAPWELHAPAIVLALHVTNVSQTTLTDAAAYALLNFHLGSGTPAGTDGEHIVWDATNRAYTETGPSGVTLAYVPVGDPTHHGASPNNPYPIGLAGGALIDTADSGTGSDNVAGFEWVFPSLAAGADQWVAVVVTAGSAADARTFVNSRTPDVMVSNEVDAWNAWRVAPPAGLTAVETRSWRQAETVLRIGQSREAGAAGGQIVAALPPGQWWITWVRDMTYAIAALARSGHMAEAQAGVTFLQNAQAGMYMAQVGHPYHVSVVRYYGDGEEWSDSNENGPNIEFDGFGLAPWAARLAGSNALDNNVDTLRLLVDPTGLIAPDSSIWEVHWNGQQKHFAYTSITAAHAMCLTGDATSARAVRDAMVHRMILPTGGLAGNLEELDLGQPARDAAAVEAINRGLIDPHGLLASNTIAEFDHRLRTAAGHGYYRNDDGGGYDSQEWVFIDLRVASALRAMGRTADADALLAWVTAQADANEGLQAELYQAQTADYVGSIPMVGFGAGAYMLALLDRTAPEASHPECFPPETNVGNTHAGDGGTGGTGSSSGCNARGAVGGGAASGGWMVLALALLARRRRRAMNCAATGRQVIHGLALLTLLLVACGPVTSHPDAAVDTGPRADGPPSVVGPPVRDCTSRFTYPLGHQASSVAVAGDWNMFSQNANPMTDGLGTNTYRGAATLMPGSYAYKFVADGNWALDPTNALTAYAGGIENSRVIVPDCNTPALSVTSWNVAPDKTITMQVQYTDGAMRAGFDPTSLVVTMNGTAVPASAIAVDMANAQINLTLQAPANNKYTFHFDAKDTTGRMADQLIVPMWVEAQPFEWGDGPMYFVFTDRFKNGNPANDTPIAGVDMRANYQGGDFAGVLAALQAGYFDQLGVRVLWLSPVNDNTESPGIGSDGRQYSAYHGYWVSNPRATENHFGSLDDLRAVTAEAHRRGIRVVLDIAMNQLHQDHPYWQMHRDWFNGDGSCECGGPNCDWDNHRLECWFAPYLPDVNWTNMTAVDQMIDDALWWLENSDADGFRVDAVKHMQAIATTTLRLRIRDRLESGNARYYLVGETFSGEGDRAFVESYVSNNQLWGQFDFPLYWSLDYAFSQNGGTMGDLDSAVQQSEAAYVGGTMSPFLGNQDVPRFLTRASGQLGSNPSDQAWTAPPPAPDSDGPYNQTFLAFTFLLAQRGVPLMYYGDEIGMPGAADPDNRRFMRFGTDLSAREQHLLERVQIVAHARGTHPGLMRGARRTLYTDGDGYVFTRGADQDLAIVAINRGSTSRSVHVTVPPELSGGDGVTLHDLLGGPSITITGGGFDMPFTPQNAALYVR